MLVGEGVLTKSCRRKPKPRQFFLFNDILVYGSIIINKKKYTTQHVIPLEVRRRIDQIDKQNVLCEFFRFSVRLILRALLVVRKS